MLNQHSHDHQKPVDYLLDTGNSFSTKSAYKIDKIKELEQFNCRPIFDFETQFEYELGDLRVESPISISK